MKMGRTARSLRSFGSLRSRVIEHISLARNGERHKTRKYDELTVQSYDP